MKLRTKLVLAELPLVLVLALVGAYAIRTVVQLGGAAGRILEDNYQSIVAGEHMARAIDEAGALVLATPPGQPAPVASLVAAVARLERELAFQESNVTEAGEEEATRALRHAFEGWKATLDAMRPPLSSEARLGAYVARVRPAEEVLRGAIDAIVVLNQDAILRKSRATSRLAASLTESWTALSLGALALVVLAGISIAKRVAQPLSALAGSAQQIGEGDLDVALPPAKGDDEVATLVREFARMTERLRAYRQSSIGELLEASEAAQAAIDSLLDPVISFQDDGTFRRANDAARRLLQVDPDGGAPLDRLTPDLRAAIERVRDKVLRGQSATPQGLEDAVPVLVHGTPRYYQPLASAIHGHKGTIVGATVLLRDVTSLRRADELKSDLLATVAHELRTPLTSLRMAVHLCLEKVVGPLNEKQEELLLAARDDADRIHALVEGILSMSRIESGALVGRRRPANPRELVEAAVGPLRIPAADQGIALDVTAPELPPVEVDTDSIVIVLTNLIANALKHSPSGGRVAVRVAPEDGELRFEVEDQGSGISPEHQPRLFEKFFRVPGSPPGGTGLGLAIARDVVLAHDGRIGVASEPGKGSRFWFTVPAPSA